MEAEKILLDSNILIKFFRKRNKSKSILYRMSDVHLFSISVITAFEIQVGITSEAQKVEYQTVIKNINILPIDSLCIDKAVEIHKNLKSKNKLIDLADLLIGATAIRYSLPIATTNRNHFERIENIKLIDINPYKLR